MPEEKSAPQVFTSNTTPEALEDLLTENGEAMAVISDEADSLIEIMTGLYSNGRANLDVFLKGHAGSPHKVARQKRKALLEAPSVTMGLTAQPDVLERLSGDGRKHRLRGVGLLARFLFCTPKPMVGKRIPRERKSIDSLVKARYYRGVADLLNYPRPAAPVRLIFSAKAKESWLKFQEHLEPKMAPFAELGDMSDWASKTTGCVVRIAGLLHIGDQITGALSTKSASSLEETSQHSHTDSVRGEIGETIVDQAIKLIISLIGHAAKALDTASNDGAAADAKWVLGWVAKNAKQNDKGAWFFKENDLHKSSRFKNFKRERLDKALAVLEMGERNMISKQYKLNTRKPTLIRYCNPAVFQKLP
jgi:putative DNA primase/helicase